MKTTTVKDVRKLNRSLILKEFYFNGPVTRLDVSRVTKLSPATVTNIVTDLLENGVLVEEGNVESSGGRPSVLLKVNPDLGYFIGVEIGESHIQTELFDIYFSKTTQYAINDLELDLSPEHLIDLVADSIGQVLRSANLKETDILGIGLGLPGIVDPESGISIFSPSWGWNNINLSELLRRKIAIPIYIDNGAKALSVAELLFGQGQGVDEFAVLLIGAGVGGAIVHNDLLLRGGSNSAGEIGHMTLSIDGPVCRCGSKGCFEAFIGANHIFEEFGRTKDEPQPRLENRELMKKIFSNYSNPDSKERKIIQNSIQYLGAGIANLINIENPERIILGGWLGILYGEADLDLIKNVVKKYALAQSYELVDICVSNLGAEAIPMGSAAMALIDFFENVNQEDLMVIGGNRLKQRN
ncbi:MAG: hypothetical protein CL609_13210 [Anaerolineaceae bacterium]|nr:hypothetical protein [Anaerolineaceae bacterium]